MQSDFLKKSDSFCNITNIIITFIQNEESTIITDEWYKQPKNHFFTKYINSTWYYGWTVESQWSKSGRCLFTETCQKGIRALEEGRCKKSTKLCGFWSWIKKLKLFRYLKKQPNCKVKPSCIGRQGVLKTTVSHNW